jgi:hypothetical protein
VKSKKPLLGYVLRITVNPLILLRESRDFESHVKSMLAMVSDDWILASE